MNQKEFLISPFATDFFNLSRRGLADRSLRVLDLQALNANSKMTPYGRWKVLRDYHHMGSRKIR